ncbi:MAG: NAD-dependent epimerase/dehydratase family protein, partial [Pirellulaceae bacterium]|nr:NAD-dependent epimerase/dehydratase family protein [Pirellulaceae bacterium]
MRILITGICGFVGSTLATCLREQDANLQIIGLDNFSRSGSWRNRESLQQMGIDVQHGDIRQASDIDALPAVDFVIDAAANASVLAGVGSGASSRQLIENNLLGTVNLLEYCKRHRAGFLLL